MPLGLDFSNPIVLIVTLVLVFLIIDLVTAGGGMTGGMMGGMTGMMSTPYGWVLAVVSTVLVVLLLITSGT